MAQAPARARARALLNRPQVNVALSAAVGMGGLFKDASRALLVGRAKKTAVALQFTGPLYRPSYGADDWLDAYFDRRGLDVNSENPFVEAAVLPRVHASLRARGRILWEYMAIKDDFWKPARSLASTPYISVHFRGSDKFLEAPRLQWNSLLDEAERQLLSTGLNRLFVASDERGFIDAAERRFGPAVFSLPQTAYAEHGRPPHFGEASGEVKAREALETMCALSGARVRIRAASLLSDWAETLATSGHSVLLLGAGQKDLASNVPFSS